jgi:hypothetical protein
MKSKSKSGFNQINNSGALVCHKDYCEWTRTKYFFMGLCVGSFFSFLAVCIMDGGLFVFVK